MNIELNLSLGGGYLCGLFYDISIQTGKLELKTSIIIKFFAAFYFVPQITLI